MVLQKKSVSQKSYGGKTLGGGGQICPPPGQLGLKMEHSNLGKSEKISTFFKGGGVDPKVEISTHIYIYIFGS